MFSGEMRTTGGRFFRTFTITTAFRDETDYAAVKALIESDDLPLTASGDLIGGTISVFPDAESWTPVQTASGFRRQAKFTLIETTTIVPPDTSAVPWAFYRRGVGYFTDLAKTTTAEVDDLVYCWADQSGNGYDANSGFGLVGGGDDNRPTLIAANELLFGHNPDGAAERSGIIIPDMSALDVAEMMVGVRSENDPPATGALVSRVLFVLSSDGNPGTVYPSSTGHIQDSFGLTTQQDMGDPTPDLTGWNVYNVSGSNDTGELISRLNNVELATVPSLSFNWDRTYNPFGIASLETTTFQGRVRDIVIFASLLNTTQRLSWYNYLRGATSVPPL